MKFISLLALALIAQSQLVKANDTPYCTSEYYSKSVCKKFHLPKGPDCDNNGGDPYDLNKNHPAKFSSERAWEYAVGITNVFENSEPQNDYATCTNIGDGRGYTCGSGGYTSDDGSMQDPLQRYATLCKKHKKKNVFGKYMKMINKIADNTGCSAYRGSISGLNDLGPTWTKTACTDSLFREAQDQAAYSEIDYWALRHAAYFGIKTNLGLAIFRDTMEQHGDGGGEPHIGLERVGELAKAAFGGKIPHEKEFIPMFLKIRREMLCCYRPVLNGKADKTWPESADRISDLQHLVKTGNWDLKPPINLPAYGYTIKSSFNLRATPEECKKIHKRDEMPIKKRGIKHNRASYSRRALFANATIEYPYLV